MAHMLHECKVTSHVGQDVWDSTWEEVSCLVRISLCQMLLASTPFMEEILSV